MMSPVLRTSVFGPGVVRSGCAALLISKSKLVVPDVLTRVQPRYSSTSLLARLSLAT
jgi:hypothetical protein